jgi:hypothetical protein
MKVHTWCPVIALVVLDEGRSAGGAQSLIISHSESKSTSTLNSVYVTRSYARADDRVHTANGKWALAIEMIDCESAGSRRIGRSRSDER